MPGFGIKGIVDSGSEVVMKNYTSAPKKKALIFRLVLTVTFAKILNFGKGFYGRLFTRVPTRFDF
jgi:hypothetical protein